MLKQSVTIASLQERVTELETQNSTLTTAVEGHAGAITAKDAKITELTGQVTALEGEKTTLTGQVTALEGEKTSLTEKVTALEGEKTELTGKVTKLEGEKTTVDVAADTKAREIAARNGTDLPAKAPGAGDSTTDDAKTATGSPTEKLSSIFEPKTV